VAGFALAAGACRERQEAVTLATSEAVTNAVIHAYEQPGGSFQVTASFMPGELWLMVADDGAGMRPGRTSGGLGVGLAVIAQLADDFEIIKRSSGGTELRMRFQLKVEYERHTGPQRGPRSVRGDLARNRAA
jgi:stage II sporulation protein AB (anti-sigma F factor)